MTSGMPMGNRMSVTDSSTPTKPTRPARIHSSDAAKPRSNHMLLTSLDRPVPEDRRSTRTGLGCAIRFGYCRAGYPPSSVDRGASMASDSGNELHGQILGLILDKVRE